VFNLLKHIHNLYRLLHEIVSVTPLIE
jgi:hypothetical protein